MIDRAVRKFAETPRQAGDKRSTVAPVTPSAGVTVVGGAVAPEPGRTHAAAVAIKGAGAAGLDHGNDFGGHPQLGMELRDWRESAIVRLGVSGPVAIDPNLASVWYVRLSGNAQISLVAPAPIPAEQLAAGRDRHRSVGVMLYLERAGHTFTVPVARFPDGEYPDAPISSPLEVYAFQWIGGPLLPGFWVAFPCGAGFALPS